jgi:peroxiredoxin
MSFPTLSRFAVGGLVAVLLPVLVVAFESPEHGSAWVAPEAETDAPDFTLDTISDETVHLRAYRGEVVLLNFWATWCPPCRKEIPDLVALQDDLGDEGLQIVGVALERDAGAEEVRQFADEMEINYPVGIGDGSIARRYGVPGLPTTFVIDRSGTIRGKIPGMVTEERMRPGLTDLLSEGGE